MEIISRKMVEPWCKAVVCRGSVFKGGCGSELLIHEPDVFMASHNNQFSRYFKCPVCNQLTAFDEAVPFLPRLGTKEDWPCNVKVRVKIRDL